MQRRVVSITAGRTLVVKRSCNSLEALEEPWAECHRNGDREEWEGRSAKLACDQARIQSPYSTSTTLQFKGILLVFKGRFLNDVMNSATLYRLCLKKSFNEEI